MKLAGILLVLLFPSSLQADWDVDPEGSYVGFATVKNDIIAENHSFGEISGEVSSAGVASIRITLASVETLIPIRNERLQANLFNTKEYPIAEASSTLQLDDLTALDVGESKSIDLDLLINLHGTDLKKAALVKVTRSSAHTFEVSSLGPMVFHASQFSLSEGVEALRKIAGLQSIDLMVPVTFDLRLVERSATTQ